MKLKLEDILGFGKVLPIDKLIDVVSKSVGKISKSYFDRKDVDTKAYEIKKLAEARAEEMKIIATAVEKSSQLIGSIEYKENKISISSLNELPIEKQHVLDPHIEERTQNRVDFQEAKKQINIENVTAFAAAELKNEPPVTNEPLDEDWTTRFFRIVEDISNEEMQALWGKILAGEIKQPKSYSLRTLELIRNLSKNEADIFMKVANFAVKVESENVNFLFNSTDGKVLEKYNISYRDIALLTEIGLMQPGTFVSYQLIEQPTDYEKIFTAGNIVIIVKIKANTPTTKMPVHVFSNSGNELLKTIDTESPLDYLTLIANSIKSENVEVKYARILAREEDSITHTQPLQDFP